MRSDKTPPEVKSTDIQGADLEQYGKLRNYINAGRENLRQQLKQVQEAIITKKQELNLLEIALHKLEGAIEVSDDYLKAALPSNNPKS